MSEMGTATACYPEPVYEARGIDTPPLLIGHSPAFCRVREDLAAVAVCGGPALVSGEPGCGKSLVARTLHVTSARASEPFLVVSCRDIPETLFEADLFGCLKGAVVGASSDRSGVLQLAHCGTVVLECIEAISPRGQGLLVGFLESGEVRKVGAAGPGPVADVRIVGVTTARLSSLVDRGQFREDLWSRLAVNHLAVPPLRDRRQDVPVLVDYFARIRASRTGRGSVRFAPEAQRALMGYSWPANVRELRGVVERLVAGTRAGTVEAHDLPVGIRPRRTGIGDNRDRVHRRTVGEELFARLINQGESFWTCVYPLFMEREITRSDVRDLMRRGLQAAGGRPDGLVALFNMPDSDRRRFLEFLRKYDCQWSAER